MPSGQFSHFRDKMSLARDTGHSRSIPGRSRPFRDGWQAFGIGTRIKFAARLRRLASAPATTAPAT